MKYYFTTLLLVVSLMISISSHVYAARVYIESPRSASSNRGDFTLTVFLDPEKTPLSAVSANFSFPSELFDVKTISTQNGIVPLWLVPPHISTEKSFDQRTHITFEGIIPGGFSGVHSPYGVGTYPGVVFTVTLIPKGQGQGNFILSDIELHAYDDTGSTITLANELKAVTVPVLSGRPYNIKNESQLINSPTISMDVSTNETISKGSPYVYVHESDPSRLVDHIEIVETDRYNPEDVSKSQWHTATNPYVLVSPIGTKYIHAKIVYSDNTYAYKTMQPVENSKSFSDLSRILIYIIVAIFLLYHYGKLSSYFFKKHINTGV